MEKAWIQWASEQLRSGMRMHPRVALQLLSFYCSLQVIVTLFHMVEMCAPKSSSVLHLSGIEEGSRNFFFTLNQTILRKECFIGLD